MVVLNSHRACLRRTRLDLVVVQKVAAGTGLVDTALVVVGIEPRRVDKVELDTGLEPPNIHEPYLGYRARWNQPSSVQDWSWEIDWEEPRLAMV